MSMKTLFLQLHNIRKKTSVPLLLMGYLNPVLQYGFQGFCERAAAAGIDGLIIPDLPMQEYEREYKKIVTANNLKNIFLITPDTSEDRIRKIDALSSGFIYMVSSASTTGKTRSFSEDQLDYFKRIASMNLKNPAIAGFGIHNRETKEQVFKYVNGAIVGSAFMRALKEGDSIEIATTAFLKSL